MVRLLPILSTSLYNLPEKFQSHNGAIAAEDEETGETYVVCFNPTMVRLLLFKFASNTQGEGVSIPQWCDCCRSGVNGLSGLNGFQSHNGAIAAVNILTYRFCL